MSQPFLPRVSFYFSALVNYIRNVWCVVTDASDLKMQNVNHTLTTILLILDCFFFPYYTTTFQIYLLGSAGNKTKILTEAIVRAPLVFHFLCGHPAIFIHEPWKHDVCLDETPGYIIHTLLDCLFDMNTITKLPSTKFNYVEQNLT